MNAAQIPERDLELTTTAIRLIRRAPDDARAADIERQMAEMDPSADADTVRRCLGHAGRLLS